VLKIKDSGTAWFSLKHLHYHPSTHQRCPFLHQYQQQTSLLILCSPGVSSLLWCELCFGVVFSVLLYFFFFFFFFFSLSQSIFFCLSDQHILEEDHGCFMESKPVKTFLSKCFLDITILISTFHRYFETPACFNSYSTETRRRYT